MAGRVNTKFVVTLSAVLLALACGASVLAYFALEGRAARWVAKGDAYAAEGNFTEASKHYERAVGKDRTNLEWLEKWRSALVKTVPNNRARYEEQYNFYRSILRQMAVLQPRDPEAQLRYLDEVERLGRSTGYSRTALERIMEDCTDRLRDLEPDSPGAMKILRYRGAAAVDRMGLIKPSVEERERARKDLEAAVKALPDDFMARVYLARWYTNEAERLRTERYIEEEAEHRAQAAEIINQLEADFPGHPEVALAVFAARQAERLRTVVSPKERLQMLASMKSDALKVVDVALSAPPELVTADLVDRTTSTILRIVGSDAIAPLTALVDRMLERYPDDARLLLDKGVLLQESGRIEEAIAQFQRVVDLPDRPVSLEGLLLPGQRMSAMAFQIDCSLLQWDASSVDTDRAAALARAKKYREQLVKEAGLRGKEILLLREAKIAYAERRYDETVAKLSELRATGSAAGRSLEALQVMAQALQLQQNYGEARRVLNEMLDIAPSLAWTHAQLGEVNLRLGRMEEARDYLASAVQLDPDNTHYRDRLRTLKTALGGQSAAGSESDPVVLGLLESRRLRDEQGDLEKAREIVQRLLRDYPEDRRVFTDLIALDLREGLKDVAIARVEKMLEKFPDDNGLKRMLTQLKIEDPVQAALAFIDEADFPPAMKALEKYKIYIQGGRHEEAKAALAEAERVDPENPAVMDMVFVDALGRKDYTKAQQVAQAAARLDIDQLGGLLYLGRLQLIEGETSPEKAQAAVRTFEDAVKRVPMNPTIRKLLAQAYMRVGRYPEAVEAFKRALEGKPDDIIMARDYIGLLMRLNRGREALDAVGPDNGILKFFPANREMLLLWMDLESRFGNRGSAVRAREELYKLEPTNTMNTFALAEVYIQDERWEDAERLINELRERPDVNPIGLARLRSNLLSSRDDIDGGIQAIKEVIRDDMSARDKTTTYLLLADYYRRHGLGDEAAASMRKARETQDPRLMEADRAMGDMYFEWATAKSQSAAKAEDAGEMDIAQDEKKSADEFLKQAAASYESVYAAVKDNPEDATLLGKRMAETYLRLRNFDRAESLVATIAKADPDDMQVLLLRGAIAAERGDRRAAKLLYDRAVTLNSSNPNVYFQRALFNLSVEDPEMRKSLLPDVLLDLEQVTKLRPGLVTAWTKRYLLLRESGRRDEAIAVIRAAIDANRESDDLRLILIKDLAISGKILEMQNELLRAAGEREAEQRWLRLGARILSQPGIERYREAAELLERFYEKKPSPDVAAELLDAHLRPGNTPTRQRIQQLMGEFEKVAKADSLYDTMLKARARLYTAQNDLAERHLSEALAIVGNDGARAQMFMNYLILAKDGRPVDALEWLKNRARAGTLNPYLANVLLSARRGEEKPENIISQAKDLLSRAEDDLTRVEILRLMSGVHYAAGQYDASAEVAMEAIRIMERAERPDRNPAYLEMLNNLAYTLVSQLNRAAEGLPYAERAAAAMPNSSTVLDTLGWAYHKAGNQARATDVLTKALQHAATKDDSFISAVHLGHAYLAAGDKAEARRALRRAEDDAKDARTDDLPEYKQLLESLRKALD